MIMPPIRQYARSWLLLLTILCCACPNLLAQRTGFTSYQAQVNAITQDDSPLLRQILESRPEWFGTYLRNADAYRIQIVFTQINRYGDNQPVLKHHTFRLDTAGYFYPASAVKLPVALVALEKLHQLNIPGLDKFTPLQIEQGHSCQTGTMPSEISHSFGHAHLGHYIKDVFLVSGNLAYDRLYEFVGQRYLNERLWQKGYRSVQITRRYGHRCSPRENRYTNPMRFVRGDTLIYEQELTYNPNVYRKGVGTSRIVRESHIQPDGTVRFEPQDYTQSNFISVKDLHEILIATMMPQAMPAEKRFRVPETDLRFVRKYMSMFPTESMDPVYSQFYGPCRMKYLVYGNEASQPDSSVRIFNKVGLAAGYLTDTAYIVDFDAHTEFFVTAVIYCPPAGATQDGGYTYYSRGMPFLKHLGQTLLDYERNRQKKILPDLDEFRYDYSTY